MSFVAIDLETTGLEQKKDKIIEVALVRFDENTYEVLDTYTSLVNPLTPIPEINANITGIVDADVMNAPTFLKIRDEVENFIGEDVIVGHNVFFDIGFLVENGVMIKENKVIDTFFLANFLLFHEPSLSLESLALLFSIPLTGAHRALNDTMATLHLLKKLEECIYALPQEKNEMLRYIFSLSRDKNTQFLATHFFALSKTPMLEEKFIKMLIDIIDKKHIYSFYEKLSIPLKKEKYSDIIEKIPSFHWRENQKKLMEEVIGSLEKNEKIVVEAPTGLGKTFAYLIPSIFHSLKTGEQVIISTKTKALQDQLFYKDLDSLHKNLGYDFLYMKLKGKQNYFSISSFLHFLHSEEAEYTKVGFFAKVILWLYDTQYGELDEMNFFSEEFAFMREINSEHKQVSSEKNPLRDYEFYYIAKSAQKDANILIVNHALLFADIESNGDISQNAENIIFDEAHSLEDVATDALRKKFNKNSFEQVLESIKKECIRKNIALDILNKKVEKLDFDIDFIQTECVKFVGRNYDTRNNFVNILIKDRFFFSDLFQGMVKKIVTQLSDLLDLLDSFDLDIFQEKTYIQNVRDVFIYAFQESSDKDEHIKILTYSEKYGLNIEYTYLNTGAYMEEHIWSKLKNIILLSATMKVGDSFSYIQKALSLSSNQFSFLSFESDFDYKKYASLYIPKDIGSIKSNFAIVSNFIQDVLSIVKGKGLILFTSFSSIRSFYLGANMDLKEKGIHILAQSIFGSKFKILSLFKKKSDTSIIVGTDSFWEGVDLPGDDLQYLFIHKFPFQVPSDPIFEARSKLYKDSFAEYSMPKAIIKLKQGFGRLIRSKSDRGIVFLLDDRIFSTKWGKSFFDAFPKEINIHIEPKEKILSMVKEYIKT